VNARRLRVCDRLRKLPLGILFDVGDLLGKFDDALRAILADKIYKKSTTSTSRFPSTERLSGWQKTGFRIHRSIEREQLAIACISVLLMTFCRLRRKARCFSIKLPEHDLADFRGPASFTVATEED
jgi:hypothetical protein